MSRKWKIGLAVAAGLALLLWLAYRFFVSIHAEEWRKEADAVRLALEQTPLTKAERVQPFNFDVPYHIVEGIDEAGRAMLVWVGATGIHAEYADSGITAEEARQKTMERAGDADVLRVKPGKMGDTLVWEVFYRRPENGGNRYYYDYYEFKTGEPVDTWTLSAR